MEQALILELLDRHGKVVLRQRFTQFPVRVGRDYGNDLILDDEAVSPRHLQIAPAGDGQWQIEDLQSDNGTWRHGSKQRIDKDRIANDGLLRLGSSTLQLRSPASQVAPTVRHASKAYRLRRTLGSWWLALPLLLLTIALSTFNEYLNHADKVHASDFAGDAVTWTGMLLLWSGAWALLGRLLNQRHLFVELLSLATMCLLAVFAAGATVDRLHYLGGPGWWNTPLDQTVWLLLAALLPLHLLLTTRLRQRTLLTLCIVLFCLFSGQDVIKGYVGERKFSDELSFNSQLNLLPASMLPYDSADEFLRNTRSVREDAERRAKQE
ncbi:FHA domain-containing protein [Andreprevotia lacus DSM 23236]|jgi:pSer/pThr/pTyr-binding forkhead associated (FHA) protein|uniref:FHA domain-containing protein n=1 Tax=Andreprevotia lacus DSM 23236 TaxID=1121001 RepID=A0A1W1XYW4_9NEIS|nr:FHA domain-containing protein [Andreprevotia lacus]SMC29160.1 FHA domain-containing protein [Andreprevotia lacus DSM 23236]